MIKWLARRTRDPTVMDSIPITAHVAIVLGKQFFSVHPFLKVGS